MMLSAKGIRNACPRCAGTTFALFNRSIHHRSSFPITRPVTATSRHPLAAIRHATKRNFSNSKYYRQDDSGAASQESQDSIEKVVRDAKQRFRDTLPKDYLTAQEYALYERLYGPPLRETEPEDVGIPTHADMGSEQPFVPANEGTVLREIEGGEFEEVSYKIAPEVLERQREQFEEELAEAEAGQLIEKAPGYVEVVARSQREHDALQKLLQDFEATKRRQNEQAESAMDEIEEAEEAEEEEPQYFWPPEDHAQYSSERELGETKRFHPYTLEGRFHGSPVEISLPQQELVLPIRNMLDRSHHRHVRKAAEDAFGGPGLPLSPVTPEGMKNGKMGGVGLPPDQRHMTEIEADAFLAGYMAPAYASVAAALREVRRRVGGDWLQSRLKQGGGGLSVLDAGAGGAGLVAWEQVVQAEWDLLKERGEVSGDEPPGKKTVVVGSDRLRQRIKGFLDNTTFLPRLPDYEHSGEMHGEHLDAGQQPQPRKKYDVVMATHLFLKETQDHYRQAVLNNLWSLVNPEGGVLIVIEKAHPRGFEAVAHVRDTIVNRFLLPQSGEVRSPLEDFNPAFDRELEHGHIVAPCTNHAACPMYKEQGKSKGRKDYCHFSQRFVRPAFYSKMFGIGADNRGEVEFSYIAVQRGVAKDSGAAIGGKEASDRAFKGFEASDEQPDMLSLPRVVLPPLKRKGHVTLDLCTPEGKIERWTVPRSYSKLAYHDARKSRWGDLWPLGAKTRVGRTVRAGSGPEKTDGGKRTAEGKKPRHVVVDVDGQRVSADDKTASKSKKARGAGSRKQDLMRELFRAEEAAEEEMGREMDEVEIYDESASRRRRSSRGSRE